MIDAGQTSAELLAAVAAIQRQFITDPSSPLAFSKALRCLVESTESEFGFIAETEPANRGKWQLKLHASFARAASTGTRTTTDGDTLSDPELRSFSQLPDEVIRSQRVVIRNSIESEPRRNGLASTPSLVSFCGLPLFDDNGGFVGLVGLANRTGGYADDCATPLQPMCDALGVMVAAAARQRAQRQEVDTLRMSEARWRIFADHVTDGLFLQDAEMRVIDVNRRACESLGYAREELLGLTPFDFDTEASDDFLRPLTAKLAAGEAIAFDSRHRRKDGSTFPVEIRVRPLWIDGKFHTVALVCDITERKRADERLHESEERLQLALKASKMGVWEWNIETDESYLSPECLEMYGDIPFDGTGKSFNQSIHPDDLPTLVSIIGPLLESGVYASWEFRILSPRHGVRWIANWGTVRRNADGKAVKMIGTALDITDKVRAETTLRESELRFRALVEVSSQIVWTADADGHVIDDSPPWREFTGQTYDQWRDCGWLNAIHPDDQPASAQEWDRCRQAQVPVNLEYRLWHAPSRGWRWVSDRGVCLRNPDGTIRSWVGMTTDVHERKTAEEALRRSTMLLENVVENIPLAVFVKDPLDNFRVRLWNKGAESIFGIPREDILGCTAHDYWPGPQADFYEAIDRQVIDEGKMQDVAETSNVPHTGESMILHTRKMPLFDSQGKPTLLLAICDDITERRRSEEALRQAQQRLDVTLRAGDVGLWDWDLATNEVVYSDQWKSQLGYQSNEIKNRESEWESRVHPDDLEAALANIRKTIAGRDREYRSEFRLRHKDGSWRWIFSRGTVISDANGKPVRMLGVHIDITERKRAEADLQASESRYRCFVDHATDALFLQDRDGRVVDVNEQACVSLGYERNELIGMLPLEFDPDITTESMRRTLDRLGSGETIAFDSRHQRKNGTTFPVEIRLRPFYVNEDRFHIALVRDITDRKRSEQALRESEARLRTLLENLDKVAVQAYEPDGTVTFWNRASELFYGYKAEEALGHDLVELLHSEHTRGLERRIMAESLRTGKPPGAEEVEVVRSDGSKITVFASRVVHPRPGKPPEFFCFDVDITEKKRAEEELARRQAELLHASRLSTVGQMVAEISHEVAQPLNAIGNFAAASARILDGGAEHQVDELHEDVTAILKQNERCVAILDRLRDFSRRAPSKPAPCDVSTLLHESVELVAHDLRRNRVNVRYELDDELPPVTGDRIQFQQLFVNLLNNARDAVQDLRKDRRTITIRAYAEHDTMVVEVSDRGVGLAEDAAVHLFDPFFTTKEHGMGIGLSICQSIVIDHGGKIEGIPNQDPDIGATFQVRLPFSGKRRP